MPSPIVVNLHAAEPARLREQRRRLRLLCPLLRLHILLLLAQHRSPSEIAEWLWCSRSSVYEVATRWRQGWRPEQETPEADTSLALAPSLRRRLLALLRKPPIVEGWCRTRWSGATLALSLQARRGLKVSAETVRRWLHPLGWSWKRTKLIAPDNDPERAVKLARIRLVAETLRPRQALLFADEWALALLPKSGYQGMPKGTPVEGMTPGKNEKHYAAGAWNFRTGTVHYRFGPGKTNPLFRDLLDSLAVIRPGQSHLEVQPWNNPVADRIAGLSHRDLLRGIR